jgi:hypothetical protein
MIRSVERYVPTETIGNMAKSRSSSGGRLQLVWVGLSNDCIDKRLNTHPLKVGTDLAVGLERINASGEEEPLPSRVHFFQGVESLLQRLTLHKPQSYESLAVKKVEKEGYIGWAQTLTLPKPGEKGTVTIFCSTSSDRSEPTSYVTSVASGAIEVSRKKAFPSIDIGALHIFGFFLSAIKIKPRGEKTFKYEVAAPLDPDVEFDVLLPGGQPDLNDYLENYIAEVAVILGVSGVDLAEEFQRRYGAALTPAVGEQFQGSVTPRTLHLEDEGRATVTLTVANNSSSRMPALLALRARNLETGDIAVSDLLAINMPLAMGLSRGTVVPPARASTEKPHAGAP